MCATVLFRMYDVTAQLPYKITRLPRGGSLRALRKTLRIDTVLEVKIEFDASPVRLVLGSNYMFVFSSVSLPELFYPRQLHTEQPFPPGTIS